MIFYLSGNSFAFPVSSSKLPRTPGVLNAAQASKPALSLESGKPIPPTELAPAVEGSPTAPSILTVLLNSVLPVDEGIAVPIDEAGSAQAQNGAQKPSLIASLDKFNQDVVAAGSKPDPLFTEKFDGAGAEPPDVPVQLPPGITGVSVDVVRTAKEIERLIPKGGQSKNLIRQLANALPSMGSYRIYTYTDVRGGSFTAIDLSVNPGLVNVLPEQESHEVALIRKLQVLTKDLQVMVREAGMTPDLVMGGALTELKSRLSNDAKQSADFMALIRKANKQVFEHSEIHGLGPGAVVVDLTHKVKVPVEAVLANLEKWRLRAQGVVLSRIYVFAGADLKIFKRQEDGSYQLEKPAAMPSALSPRAKPIEPKDFKTLRFIVAKTRLEKAYAHFGSVRKKALQQGSEDNIKGLKSKLMRFGRSIRKGEYEDAFRVWERFVYTHSAEAIRKVALELNEVLPSLALPETLSMSRPRNMERFGWEIQEPPRIIREKGLLKSVAVYGNAQAVEGSYEYREARRFGEMVAVRGGGKAAVATLGGTGVMQAANRGAFEAGGLSIGHNDRNSKKASGKIYQTPGLDFVYQHPAIRRMNLRRGASALVFFPNAASDDLFEALALMHMGKMARVPVVLVGKQWPTVIDLEAYLRLGLISKDDLAQIKFVTSAEEAWAAVSGA